MVSKPPSDPLQSWDLPAEPYVPGKNGRPGESASLYRIVEAAPPETDPAEWPGNTAWLAGFRLYEHGFFWEAHEVWEAVWMGTRQKSPERSLLQGVIQLANASLKLRMGKLAAARRLAAMAASHIDDAARGRDALLMGVDLINLRVSVQQFNHALATGERAIPPSLALSKKALDA